MRRVCGSGTRASSGLGIAVGRVVECDHTRPAGFERHWVWGADVADCGVQVLLWGAGVAFDTCGFEGAVQVLPTRFDPIVSCFYSKDVSRARWFRA